MKSTFCLSTIYFSPQIKINKACLVYKGPTCKEILGGNLKYKTSFLVAKLLYKSKCLSVCLTVNHV